MSADLPQRSPARDRFSDNTVVVTAVNEVRQFAGIISRDTAAGLLPLYHGYAALTDDERAAVLARFPAVDGG